jgi:hypothetical protein
VQARPGYFAAVVKAEPPPSERRIDKDRIDKEIMADDTLEEVPVRISSAPGQESAGPNSVRMVMRLDVAHLELTNKAGVHRGKITMVAALFDADGGFVTGKQCELDLRLKQDTFARFAGGMDAALTLSAPPGKYRLRGVVEEAGKITASSLAVELPM